MRSIRLLLSAVVLAALVALVGCSGNTKNKGGTGPVPGGPLLKDAPKDADKITVPAPQIGDPGKAMSDTKRSMEAIQSAKGARGK